MTTLERILYASGLAVCLLLVLAFSAEHIWLTIEAQRHSPSVIESCPPRK